MATKKSTIIKKYSELIRITGYEDRYNYLKLVGNVAESTFGFDRHLNQALYTSQKWRKTRDEIILRDNGCDMGLPEWPIGGKIIVHHMNPLTMEDIEDAVDDIFNPEYLICVSHRTHEAIHFGDFSLLPKMPVDRKPGDTCPWH